MMDRCWAVMAAERATRAPAGVTFGPCMAASPPETRSRGSMALVLHFFTLFLSLYISILSRKKIGIKALKALKALKA